MPPCTITHSLVLALSLAVTVWLLLTGCDGVATSHWLRRCGYFSLAATVWQLLTGCDGVATSLHHLTGRMSAVRNPAKPRQTNKPARGPSLKEPASTAIRANSPTGRTAPEELSPSSQARKGRLRSREAERREAALRQVYREFDLDGDGTVGAEEMLILGELHRFLFVLRLSLVVYLSYFSSLLASLFLAPQSLSSASLTHSLSLVHLVMMRSIIVLILGFFLSCFCLPGSSHSLSLSFSVSFIHCLFHSLSLSFTVSLIHCLSHTASLTLPLSHCLSLTHSHTLLISCTCCYDQIKGTQEKDFSYSLSDSLSLPLSHTASHSLPLSAARSLFIFQAVPEGRWGSEKASGRKQ